MGGQDKGLLPWRGQSLLAHVQARFAPQVACLALSANRPAQHYQHLGLPVLPDLVPGLGPLGGIERALYFAQQNACPLVALVPCDAPLLPPDLVLRLHQGLQAQAAMLAIATTPGRDQPLFALLHSSLHGDLAQYLRQGAGPVWRWQQRWSPARVCFDEAPAAFGNFNTPTDLITTETPS